MENFGFTQLDVWKKSLKFSKAIVLYVNNLTLDRKHYRLIEQIESSSSSIFLNIAEGYGRGTTKDYIRFLYISRGSLYETVSMIEFFKELNWIDNMKYQEFHTECTIIGKMLNSLISSLLKKLRNPQSPNPQSPNPQSPIP